MAANYLTALQLATTTMDQYLVRLKVLKEALFDFALMKRSNLNKSKCSILITCTKVLQSVEDHFDESGNLKVTSVVLKALPMFQIELELWYNDMNLLMNIIQHDLLHPSRESDIVSIN